MNFTDEKCHTGLRYYPHMPMGTVWIYRLLFVCLFVRLRISPSMIKLTASNSASKAGNLPFWRTLLPQNLKIDESARGDWT